VRHASLLPSIYHNTSAQTSLLVALDLYISAARPLLIIIAISLAARVLLKQRTWHIAHGLMK
jgi:hypothetical protein